MYSTSREQNDIQYHEGTKEVMPMTNSTLKGITVAKAL